MTVDSWYKEHDAFERTLEWVKANPPEYQGFIEASKVHHAPDKLELFKDFSGYVKWFNGLYSDGQHVVKQVEKIWGELHHLKISWYSRTRHIRNLLDQLYCHDLDITAFRSDVAEFQRCMMASGIHEKEGYANTLQNLVHRLDSLESRIILTANSQVSSINTTRLTLVGLFLSALAVFIAA
ncbi:MAG: hypothetical protein OWU33_16370 [Firmicutes bacterium]|nr:hypothetical protein [Bacillota bacterium]